MALTINLVQLMALKSMPIGDVTALAGPAPRDREVHEKGSELANNIVELAVSEHDGDERAALISVMLAGMELAIRVSRLVTEGK